MSHSQPRYLGNEGETSARYRVGSFSRFPLAPHQMQERFTPTQDLIVLCHLGVPQFGVDSWSLTIDGLVARPLRLDFSDLTSYPRHTISGAVVLCSRACSHDGAGQPEFGRRNAIHRIEVKVV